MVDRYIILVNLLFITVISGVGVNAAYGVATAWMDFSEKPRAVVARTEKQKAKGPEIKPLSYYDPVIQRNIFKTEKAGEDVKKVETIDLEKLKQTSLNLKLWGTVSGNTKTSFAIIEDPASKKQDLYRVGDVIQQATLKLILRNKVVFNVNGKDEILEVETGRRQKESGRGGTARGRAARETTSRVSINRSLINDSLKDINSLMKDVRIRPHFKDGAADGLSISGVKRDSIFKKMGLRNGDILVGVDGSKIESVDDAMKLYDGLKDSSGLQVQIKRRGRLQNIDFEIK